MARGKKVDNGFPLGVSVGREGRLREWRRNGEDGADDDDRDGVDGRAEVEAEEPEGRYRGAG